ncbi:hypothetical protein MKEN_00429000 [Mycena kentingensis (nom. inval.)]|nr:hypothetical protein MKEN_00429000 [Mycena kentingensis (nom. inval.)]
MPSSQPVTPPRPSATSGSKPASTSGGIAESTPYRSFRTTSSQDHGSSKPVSQDQLKKDMGAQIEAQSWHFPVARFARMVCHYERKPQEEVDAIKSKNAGRNFSPDIERPEFYNFASDEPAFLDAVSRGRVELEKQYQNLCAKPGQDKLEDVGLHETKYYTPLAKLLNLCLAVARKQGQVCAPDGPYSKLGFVSYDRQTGDGISGAAPLKPDLVGLSHHKDISKSTTLKVNEGTTLYWNPVGHKGGVGIDLPLEVKNIITELVRQATTYARAMFDASPLRTSALVLAYNQLTYEFRFLIFHHGGLSASDPCNLSTADGRRDLFTLILALLTCRTPEDAGLATWCNEQQIKLPVNCNGEFRNAAIPKIISSELVCRGRATRVYGTAIPAPSEPDSQLETDATGPIRPKTVLMQRPVREEQKENLVGAQPSNPSSSQRPSRSSDSKAKRLQSDKAPSDDKPWTGGQISAASRRPLQDLRLNNFLYTDRWRSQTSRQPFSGKAVLKTTWVPEGASLEADILKECSGQFGCPDHHYSFSPVNAGGVRATNHLFLPSEGEEYSEFHWDIFEELGQQEPERRSLLLFLSALEGESLVYSPTPFDLLISVLHCMLGWLNMLQRGFLHRDVSIGNLLRLDKAAKMMLFVARPALLEFMTEKTAVELDGNKHDYAQSAERLMETLTALGVDDMAEGFIIDADNAVKWSSFADARAKKRSGTSEFMSNRLLDAKAKQIPFLHSPIDDLFSFYYSTQWAAAFHGDDVPSDLQSLRSDLASGGGQRARGTETIRELVSTAGLRAQYGRFLILLVPVLKLWNAKLVELQGEWRVAQEELEARELPAQEMKEMQTILFLAFGYRGIAEFAELVKSNKDRLREQYQT